MISPLRSRYVVFAFLLLFWGALGLYYGQRYMTTSMVGGLFTPARPVSVLKHGDFDAPQQMPAGVDLKTAADPMRRANACFVVLTRNSDLESILGSLEQMETRFNRRYNYPYVFLNDEPFTESFKAIISAAVSSHVSFGLVPREEWHEPEWIDQERAAASRKAMKEAKIIYGGSESYRRMCRYQSGLFFRHELMKPYDYYWRIEPGIKYFCDINYDPFLYMQDNDKKYGFTISMTEYSATIPTLWDNVKAFMEQHPEHIAEDNSMDFISSDGGTSYNLCHFWSNFEIGSLAFLRSQAYTDYFNFLDRTGGFSYERWGDAPVHSIAASLFLPTRQVHFFDDVGYYHLPFTHCPAKASEQGCFCDPKQSFDKYKKSCTNKWLEVTHNKGLPA